MTHLLDDGGYRNGVPLSPLHSHKKFTTTLRLPREGHSSSTHPRRHTQAIPAESVDTISQGMALGCLVVAAATLCVLLWVGYLVGRWAFEVLHQTAFQWP